MARTQSSAIFWFYLFFETASYIVLAVLGLCVIEVDPELLIFLSLPARFWDYRYAPPCPALRIIYIIVSMETSAIFSGV